METKIERLVFEINKVSYLFI